MKTKILEIRDRCTTIPILAFKLCKHDDMTVKEYIMLNHCGHPEESFQVFVLRLCDLQGFLSPFDWSRTSRTMRAAHDYIQKNWDQINGGDLIDVEFILGEKETKKESEFES